MTEEQYNIAKDLYLKEEKSLTYIGKTLHIDRGKLSNKFKEDGIEVINRQNITKFNQNIFSKIDTEEKAYWLGFLYADGCIGTKENDIELSLKSSDIHHLEKFRDFLGFPKDKHIFQNEIRCRISFRNKKTRQDLIDLGCIPRKSLVLTFPNEEQVPSYLIPHFVRGYIDGDGSVMIGPKYTPRLNILGTYDFLYNLRKQMGWKENKISYKNRREQMGVCSIEWGGRYVIKYLDDIYRNANIYLDRKYEKYQILKNNN